MPSSMNIGTTTDDRTLHFAVADPMNRSIMDDRSSTQTRSSGAGRFMPCNFSAPLIAMIGPMLDQLNIATKCAAKRSEEHTSELQSLMRISHAVFCLKKQKTT